MRIIKKTVDDGTSTPAPTRCTLYSSYIQGGVKVNTFYLKPWKRKKGRCHYCGISGFVVERFPRRGYERNKKELRM